MEVQEAIRRRRTTKEFRIEPIPRPLLEKILEGANWAPNHHLTHPWRFTVLEGAARMVLAQLRKGLKRQELIAAGQSVESATEEAEAAYAKLLKAPTLVIVSCAQTGDRFQREEDFAAASAAVQNMLLVSTDLGIASLWSSGQLVAAPETRELLELNPTDAIVGIIQLGYALETKESTRNPASAATRWIRPNEVAALIVKATELSRDW